MIEFISTLVTAYNLFTSSLPIWARDFTNLFLIALSFFIYSVSIWKFYRFISRKDILKLNLKRYNNTEHPKLQKFLDGLIYFFEYLIVSPFVIFIWFSIFSILLIILASNLKISVIFMISATVVATIRMTAYYKEDLSRDLAKLLPLTLLGVSIIRMNSLNFQRMLSQLSNISGFLNHILIYFLFIIIIELILRIFETLFILTGIVTEKEREEEVKSE